jgi:hypothetical protein
VSVGKVLELEFCTKKHRSVLDCQSVHRVVSESAIAFWQTSDTSTADPQLRSDNGTCILVGFSRWYNCCSSVVLSVCRLQIAVRHVGVLEHTHRIVFRWSFMSVITLDGRTGCRKRIYVFPGLRP